MRTEREMIGVKAELKKRMAGVLLAVCSIFAFEAALPTDALAAAQETQQEYACRRGGGGVSISVIFGRHYPWYRSRPHHRCPPPPPRSHHHHHGHHKSHR